MPRPLFLVAVAIFCLGVTARADDPDPRKMPVVKKVLDKAESEVRKNRKAYDEANAKTFEDAETALKEEVDRLSKAGKLEEAVAVKKFAERMGKEVLANAEKQPKSTHSGKTRAPKGAVAWNGHKYMAVRNPCRWAEAKKACEDMGGHLLIIDTQEEQNALVAMLVRAGMGRDNFWIGATDEIEEGAWTWVDGSPVAYSNWNPREPNNYGGEHYAEMAVGDGGRWNDLSLSLTRWFICEWDE